MYYIYILYSEKFDKYYSGHTDNPHRRLFEHNNSEEVSFTASYRPWKMVALFECGVSRSEAIKIEKFIKKQKTRKFIETLISNEIFFGHLNTLKKIPNIS